MEAANKAGGVAIAAAGIDWRMERASSSGPSYAAKTTSYTLASTSRVAGVAVGAA